MSDHIDDAGIKAPKLEKISKVGLHVPAGIWGEIQTNRNAINDMAEIINALSECIDALSETVEAMREGGK